MTTSEIFDVFLDVNQEAAKELINTYEAQKEAPYFARSLDANQESEEELINIDINAPNLAPCLIFPWTRDGKIRVSEQELKCKTINKFCANKCPKFSYAVEVPTRELYTFNGTVARSASTDLSFYKNYIKFLNIEFKAHNPKQESFDKDIDKLFTENTLGVWSHILENMDSGTLASIFNKLTIAINNRSNPAKPISPKKPVSFSFLILAKRMLISRKGKDTDLPNFNPNSIFSLNYANYNKLGRGLHVIGDWQIDVF